MAKRRLPGEGSIFQRPRGSSIYYAQITLPDGAQRQVRGPSQKEAQQKLTELKRLVKATPTALSEKQPTLWQWWDLWLDSFAPHLKPHIREGYRSIGRSYIETAPTIGGKPLGTRKLIDLTYAEVQAWVNALSKDVAPQTVKNAHARLHKALDVAIRKGYLERNVADHVELPRARHDDEPAATQVYTFAEAATLLDTLSGNRWQALYWLALNTGMRQAELLGLTDQAITLQEQRATIQVRQQLRRVPGPNGKTWALIPLKTKTSRRTITITDPDAVALMRQHRIALFEERLLHGKPWQARDPFRDQGGLWFVTETGAPVHASDLLQHFRRWAAKAGIPAIRFHDLRHTAATLMLASGMALPAVSKTLGHANVGITLRIYAHALEEDRTAGVAVLSQRLKHG